MPKLKTTHNKLFPFDKVTGEIYPVSIEADDIGKVRLRVMAAATQLGLQIAISARGACSIIRGLGVEPKLSEYRIKIF